MTFSSVWPLPTRAACLGAGLSSEQHALALGWKPVQAAELSLIVVELSTNAVRHGEQGVCTLKLTTDECRVEVRDSGPGYPAWVLDAHGAGLTFEAARPGHAPARGLGAGLDVVRRLASELALSNHPVTGGAQAFARIARRT